MTVEVVHWNPSKPKTGLLNRVLRRKERVNNFGDLIGPLVVSHLLAERGIDPERGSGRLLAVGSILRMAVPGDVVWGAGINGKSLDAPLATSEVDVRAVRGPLTARWLKDQGIDAPSVYGDPALLLPSLPAFRQPVDASSGVVVIPNLNDLDRVRDGSEAWTVCSPRKPLSWIIEQIRSADFVCGSSLHAIVLADAFGVPSRLIRSSAEPSFKYEDYFEGTGRRLPAFAHGVEDAMEMGAHDRLDWSGADLIEAFPTDLWSSAAQS